MEKTKPGKKIIIIRNAYSYDFGGGERMPVNLAHELNKLGYQSLIVSRSPKLLEYASSKGIDSVRGWWWARQNWSGRRILLTPIYFIWQIALFCWYLVLFVKKRPDIVHAQSKDDFISATLAGRLVGSKVIWSDHADLKYVFQNTSIWYKNPIGKIVGLCSRLASAIILTSESDKRLIEKALVKKLSDRYVVIYNGISDLPLLSAKDRDDSKVVFVATSRLVTDKGISELIAAFKEVLEKFNTSELWLFGEGPEREKFEKQAIGINGIHLKGFPADAIEQAAQADIFVHPSYLEGFSVSLVEASMLGLPIIACAVGGNPEIIEDGINGLLIAPRDSGALAKAMIKLAGDESLRKKMGQAARQKYLNNYVFEDIVKEKYLPLYE